MVKIYKNSKIKQHRYKWNINKIKIIYQNNYYKNYYFNVKYTEILI